MTQEEKAKAYDEAVINGSRLWECGKITRENYEYIFPELKESEDERIRENIIATIHLYYGEPLEDEAKEMIAWLEKQGEQKPAESINDVYPETLDKAIDLYYYSYGNGNGYFENLSFEKFKDIAKTFVSEYSKQNPAWSEEDERLRNSCISHIEEELERIRNDKYGHSEIISDLKESCRERINWLNSLRPQSTWKPSDEQMVALDDVISSRDIRYDVLSELWKDLNKLK